MVQGLRNLLLSCILQLLLVCNHKSILAVNKV